MTQARNQREIATETEPEKGPSFRARFVSFLLVAVILSFFVMMYTGKPGILGTSIQEQLGDSLRFMVSLQFLILTPLIFLVEKIIPANPKQKSLTPSVAMDAFLMMALFPVTRAFAVAITSPVSTWLNSNAAFLVLDSTRNWPLWLTAALGLLISDFAAWFIHLLKHKVPFIWRFHIVHHSQANLTFFTSNKLHPFDYLSEHIILLIPFFFLFPSFVENVGAVFGLTFVTGWFTRIQHANIASNLGPLRYFLVTPQSHRIHHSLEPRHYNSNYASIFTWDRLFGYQCSDDTSYPRTGINDDLYPEPKSYRPKHMLESFKGQMMYPFNKKRILIASDPTASQEPLKEN